MFGAFFGAVTVAGYCGVESPTVGSSFPVYVAGGRGKTERSEVSTWAWTAQITHRDNSGIDRKIRDFDNITGTLLGWTDYSHSATMRHSIHGAVKLTGRNG
jgi:hypothetical protein